MRRIPHGRRRRRRQSRPCRARGFRRRGWQLCCCAHAPSQRRRARESGRRIRGQDFLVPASRELHGSGSVACDRHRRVAAEGHAAVGGDRKRKRLIGRPGQRDGHERRGRHRVAHAVELVAALVRARGRRREAGHGGIARGHGRRVGTVRRSNPEPTGTTARRGRTFTDCPGAHASS